MEKRNKNEEKKVESVYSVTAHILAKLSNMLDTSSGKATLANLRNSIGKPLSSTVEIWPIVFDHLPEEFLGRGQNSSNEEQAILSTLQLFALYKQGSPQSSIEISDNKRYRNIGTSFSTMRTEENRLPLDRRFNVLVTSATFEELLHHLRQYIKLLKSKSKGQVEIDFARLSEDLYWFLRGFDEQIRLSWSREYYIVNIRKEGEENNDEK